MRQGAIYDFADAEDYSADHSYFEYLDGISMSYMPKGHLFTMDTREKALCGSDNGLYRFYDSIFGGDDAEEETAEEEAEIEVPVISEDKVSGSDTSASDEA